MPGPDILWPAVIGALFYFASVSFSNEARAWRKRWHEWPWGLVSAGVVCRLLALGLVGLAAWRAVAQGIIG
jgi:hypothetical protein